MAIDREKYRQRLQERTKEVYDKGSGSDFKTIFKPNLGEAVKFFKPKAGAHSLDIIPYEAGPFDPDVDVKEGDLTYVETLWVHFNVGPQKDSYVCTAKSFNMPCAVCDYIKEKQRSEADAETVKLLKAIKAKQRALYYVVVYDSPEEEKKGLQIWNAPHWKMQRILNELSKMPERQGVKVGGHISFTDPDVGKTVCFKIVGEQESTDYIGHRLLDREYIIDDKFLIAANERPIDTLIHIPEYPEVKAALFGMGAKKVETPVEEKAPVTEQPALPEQEPQGVLPLPTGQDKPPATGATVCPGGGTFGVDIDQLAACADCAIYEGCSAEETILADKRKAERAAKRLDRKTA